MRKRLRFNPFEWIGYLWAPIQKNGAFFVFMFALGWLCTQLEIMPYYLRDRGAKPYELSAQELFLDIYLVCVILTLIPQKIRIWVKALLYIFLYGIAIVDMFCYVRFESTLTPTMLMLVSETNTQEAQEFFSGYLNWDIITSSVGWILLLIVIHLFWTLFRKITTKLRKRLILPKISSSTIVGLKFVMALIVGWLLYNTSVGTTKRLCTDSLPTIR